MKNLGQSLCEGGHFLFLLWYIDNMQLFFTGEWEKTWEKRNVHWTGNKSVNDFKNMDTSMLIKFQDEILASANKNKANYTQLEATQN